MNKWRTAALFTALLMPLAAEQAAAEKWEARENVALEKQWTIELSEPYKQGIHLADYIAVQQDGKDVAVEVTAGETEKEIVVTPVTRYEENTAYELHIDETLPANFDATLKEDVILPFVTETRTPEVDYLDREGTLTYKANEQFEKIVGAKNGDIIHFSVDGLEENKLYEVHKWNKEKLEWEAIAVSEYYSNSNGVFIESKEETAYKIVTATQELQNELTFSYKIYTGEQYLVQRNTGIEFDEIVNINNDYAFEYILSAGEALELLARSEVYKIVNFEYYTGLTWEKVDGQETLEKLIDYRYFAEQQGRYRITIDMYSENEEEADFWLKTSIVAGDDKEADSFMNPRMMTEQTGDVQHTLHANKDADYFSYTLKAGQALAVQTAENITATFYKKDELLNEWNVVDEIYGGEEGVNYSFKVEENGEYIVKLENNLSDYKTRELLFSYRILDGDAGENDSLTNPRMMSEKEGELTHTLNAQKDTDYFGYTLKAGQALLVQAGKNLNAVLYMKDKGLNEWVKVDETSSLDQGIDYSFKIEVDAEYVLALKNNYKYQEENLSFRYKVLDGDAGEHDSVTNVRMMTEQTAEVNYTLNANKDKDYFGYTLKAGQALLLQTAENVRTTFYKKNERLDEWEEIQWIYDADYSFKVEEDGEYMISLENAGYGYNLNDLVFKYEILNGDVGESDSFTNPRVMTEKTGKITHTLNANKDVDYFSYKLAAGQSLNIQAASNVTVMFYRKNVFLNDWELIEDLRGEVDEIQAIFKVEEDGEYLVALSNYIHPLHEHYQLDELNFTYTITE